jgi:hypothetical protein
VDLSWPDLVKDRLEVTELSSYKGQAKDNKSIIHQKAIQTHYGRLWMFLVFAFTLQSWYGSPSSFQPAKGIIVFMQLSLFYCKRERGLKSYQD